LARTNERTPLNIVNLPGSEEPVQSAQNDEPAQPGDTVNESEVQPTDEVGANQTNLPTRSHPLETQNEPSQSVTLQANSHSDHSTSLQFEQILTSLKEIKDEQSSIATEQAAQAQKMTAQDGKLDQVIAIVGEFQKGMEILLQAVEALQKAKETHESLQTNTSSIQNQSPETPKRPRGRPRKHPLGEEDHVERVPRNDYPLDEPVKLCAECQTKPRKAGSSCCRSCIEGFMDRCTECQENTRLPNSRYCEKCKEIIIMYDRAEKRKSPECQDSIVEEPRKQARVERNSSASPMSVDENDNVGKLFSPRKSGPSSIHHPSEQSGLQSRGQSHNGMANSSRHEAKVSTKDEMGILLKNQTSSRSIPLPHEIANENRSTPISSSKRSTARKTPQVENPLPPNVIKPKASEDDFEHIPSKQSIAASQSADRLSLPPGKLDTQEYLERCKAKDADDMDYVPSNQSLVADAPTYTDANTSDESDVTNSSGDESIDNSRVRGKTVPLGTTRPRKQMALDGRSTPPWELEDWDPQSYAAGIEDPAYKTAPNDRARAKAKTSIPGYTTARVTEKYRSVGSSKQPLPKARRSEPSSRHRKKPNSSSGNVSDIDKEQLHRENMRKIFGRNYQRGVGRKY
jgi:hypothetical protein